MSMNNDGRLTFAVLLIVLHTSSMFSKPFSSNVRIANDGEIIFLLRRNIFTTIQLWRNESETWVDIDK